MYSTRTPEPQVRRGLYRPAVGRFVGGLQSFLGIPLHGDGRLHHTEEGDRP